MGGETKWNELEYVAEVIGVDDVEMLAAGLMIIAAHVSELRAKEQNRK